MKRELRLVTHKNWMVEEFKTQLDGEERVSDIVQDFGLDITREGATEKIWWAPGAFVHSASLADVQLPLTAPSAFWLDHLPIHLKQRYCLTIPLSALRSVWFGSLRGQRIFVKLPLAKIDACPARVYSHDCDLPSTFSQFGFPDNTLITLQRELKFVAEARFFMAYGQATAFSLYRIKEFVWGSEKFESVVPYYTHLLPMMRETAEEAARSCNFEGANGYVIDVGLCEESSRPVVIEANASWSSSPYSSYKEGVLTSILAAHDFEGIQRRNWWTYQANPVFSRDRPLKVVESS